MEVIVNASKAMDAPHITTTSIVHLLKAFGYTDEALPVASLLARYHNLSGEWTVLSPIYWEATHNDALMSSVGTASRALFETLQAFVAEDGVKLYYHDASTWLLACDEHVLPKTKPLHTVFKHSMRPLLQDLEQEPFWLRLITEAQMFLSTQSDAVNGVWLWGTGACHTPHHKPLVVCEDEAWCRAGDLLSTTVSLYQPEMKLPKNAACFMPKYTTDLLEQLESKFEKQNVHWFFNDTDFVTKPKKFWAKLWGKTA